MMTGVHAIHIVIGIIAIGFLTFFSWKGKYSSVWYTPVENVGLYWHIVDIIWIFVFPLMYLDLGRRTWSVDRAPPPRPTHDVPHSLCPPTCTPRRARGPKGHTEHTGHGGHHVFDAATLKKTFGILVGLTILTVVLALWERGFADVFGLQLEFPALPLGWLSVPVALGIAGTKVYWVASRFMGLKYEGGTNTLVFLGSTAFLIIFFAFTWLDFAFRDTFEELSAVPTDILEEEVLEAEATATEIADEFEATPLVGQPDPELFGTSPAPASGTPVTEAPTAPDEAPVADDASQ